MNKPTSDELLTEDDLLNFNDLELSPMEQLIEDMEHYYENNKVVRLGTYLTLVGNN